MGTSVIDAIHDMTLVKELITRPDVWGRAGYGLDSETFTPFNDGVSVWMKYEENGEIKGLILTHSDTSVSVKIHPYIISGEKGIGRNMINDFHKWVIDHTGVKKINVTIQGDNRDTYNMAKKTGFIDEGVNRASYMKDGELLDQWNLGITRNEIIEHLEGI
jgi:hypothetical protein